MKTGSIDMAMATYYDSPGKIQTACGPIFLVTSDILKSVKKKERKKREETRSHFQAFEFLHNVLHIHGCL